MRVSGYREREKHTQRRKQSAQDEKEDCVTMISSGFQFYLARYVVGRHGAFGGESVERKPQYYPSPH